MTLTVQGGTVYLGTTNLAVFAFAESQPILVQGEVVMELSEAGGCSLTKHQATLVLLTSDQRHGKTPTVRKSP